MEERPQVVLIATGRYRVDDLVEVEIGKERRRFELINGAVVGAVKKNAFEMLCRLRSSPDRALTSKSEVVPSSRTFGLRRASSPFGRSLPSTLESLTERPLREFLRNL